MRWATLIHSVESASRSASSHSATFFARFSPRTASWTVRQASKRGYRASWAALKRCQTSFPSSRATSLAWRHSVMI